MQRDGLQARLADFWSREIPLTNAMQVAIDSWDGECLVLSAALSANRNDKATAFGGSLYSLAVLAGWGLIMLRQWQAGYDSDVYIRRAKVDYVAPVRKKLVATCRLDDLASWTEFTRTLENRGKARLALQPSVAGDEGAAMRLRADFVAVARG